MLLRRPLSQITCRIHFGIKPYKLWIKAGMILVQIHRISLIKSAFDFTAPEWDWSFLLMYSHTFSIIFRSGDWAGQLRQFMWFLSMYSCVNLDRWTGALSSYEKYPFRGKCLARTGHKFSSRISWYLRDFPSTGTIVPTPSQQMHPHYAYHDLKLILCILFLNEVS